MHPAVIWAILGLASGVIAKLIMPGKDKGGVLTTALIGIVGSFLGGYIGHHFGVATKEGGLSLLSFVTAVAGALILLVLFRLLRFLI